MNKVVIVTGGAKGIGKAIVEEFRKLGAKVYVIDKEPGDWFVGGCPGNTQGVAKLVIGRKVEDVIKSLKGIQCRNGTSCPDQLARACEF